VRVIRAGDIGEAYLTVIARKLAMAGVKEARLFNGMYEHKPVEDWSSRLPGYREEAARGESVVVSLPVAKREPRLIPPMS
jgi:putative DNA primase/helicase